MTELEMRQYESQMSREGYSVFYQGRQRVFDNKIQVEVWERVNAKWAKISG